MQTRFNAIVLAGYDPEKPDPLTSGENNTHKVLIDVCGRPMIWYVVDALRRSPRIDRIAIVGLEPECGVELSAPVHFLKNQSSLVANAMIGLEYFAQSDDPAKAILLVTGDTPLLTWQAITYFLDACQPADQDLYWGIIRRETMEAVFPGSRRTYLRTLQGSFCSGDLFLTRLSAVQRVAPKLHAFTTNRKNVLKQVRQIGVGWLLRLLLGRIHLYDLAAAVRHFASGTGNVVILPFAGPGMDVDKPHQLALARAYLASRLSGATDNPELGSSRSGG